MRKVTSGEWNRLRWARFRSYQQRDFLYEFYTTGSTVLRVGPRGGLYYGRVGLKAPQFQTVLDKIAWRVPGIVFVADVDTGRIHLRVRENGDAH